MFVCVTSALSQKRGMRGQTVEAELRLKLGTGNNLG